MDQTQRTLLRKERRRLERELASAARIMMFLTDAQVAQYNKISAQWEEICRLLDEDKNARRKK
jgi:hypothetical protein